MTRHYIYAALLLALATAASQAQPGETAQSWWRDYMAGSRLVALPDGRSLNIYCEGKGTPVVVMESGLGGGAWAWRKVQPQIARTTTACSYDRAGYWKSPPTGGARDAGAEADDLAALLKAANLPAPYVLVAHSYGGYIAQLYADRHTADLAGLVLVDPSVANQDKILAQIVPAAPAMLAADLVRRQGCASDPRPPAVARLCLDSAPRPDTPPEAYDWFVQAQGPAYSAATLREYQAMGAASSDELAAERKNLGALPLILLNAGNKMHVLPGQTDQQTDALTAVWLEKHREMLSLSSAAQLGMVPDSGHEIPEEKPGAVIQAINDMLTKLRTRH